jgi:hypothetical protein
MLRMNEENKGEEPVLKMKGVHASIYVLKIGEFAWVPSPEACATKKAAKELLEVFREMPEDKSKVWRTRIDLETAIATCPIIHEDTDLRKQFEELFVPRKKNELDSFENPKGGES